MQEELLDRYDYRMMCKLKAKHYYRPDKAKMYDAMDNDEQPWVQWLVEHTRSLKIKKRVK